MRHPRIILDDEACAYHCIARTAGQEWLFDTDARKDQIQRIIKACAILKGVNLINFVIMSNHLHLLVQIPGKSSIEPLTKDLLIKQAKVLYRKAYVGDLKYEFDRAEKLDETRGVGDTWHRQQILNRYEARRGNLSFFMQEVKERITDYINKEHNRKGTLWEGRFKSPVVENTLEALLAVSTYIDLNPIRAGIVSKPEDYRWCGYSAALGGDRMAREGLAWIYSNQGPKENTPGWHTISGDYRQYLFEKGLELLADESTGCKGRLGFTAEQVEHEIKRRGKLPLHEVMLYRVRYFTDGVVIGSESFVNQVFAKRRDQLTSPNSKRTTGARRMRGADWGGLTTLRDLRLNVIGHPS